MSTHIRLLTIVAEDEIEQRLLADLEAAGVRGYTYTKVKGKGHHRLRGSEWEGENIMVHVLASEEVERNVLQRLEEAYFGQFSVTVYAQSAEVVRGEKYL